MIRLLRNANPWRVGSILAMSIGSCLVLFYPFRISLGNAVCQIRRPVNLQALDFRIYFDAESVSESEYEFWEDEMKRLLRSPLDLNTVSPEALSAVPGMAMQDVGAIIGFRERHGRFKSLSDLADIEDLTPSARKILNLVARVATERNESGAGPERSFSVRFRGDRRWDSSQPHGPASSSGSPVRSYVRFRTSSSGYSASITLQKDAYERFVWSPGKRWYGFDHIAGYVGWRSGNGRVGIVAGDYTVAMGQGLVLSRPFGSRISSDAPWRVMKSVNGARGYSGSYEAYAFRGVALGIRLSEVYTVDLFYSRRRFDARPLGGLTSFRPTSSGIHISPDQISYRRIAADRTVGAAAIATVARIKMGLLFSGTRFSDPMVIPGPPDASVSNLDGSVFISYTTRAVSAAGEYALYRLSHPALVVGATFRPSSRLYLAFAYRRHSSGGSGLHGRPFGIRRSLGPQNGLYLSWTVRQPGIWSLSASMDFAAGTGIDPDAPLPAIYRDVRFTFTLSPGGSFQMRSQLKLGSREIAGKRPDNRGSELKNVDVSGSSQISLQLTYTGPLLTLRTRFDANNYEARHQARSSGIHAYQMASVRLSKAHEVVVQHSFFDTDSYENRFYVYEKDVTGKLSVPVLTASGTRSLIALTSSLGASTRLELKYVVQSTLKNGADSTTTPRRTRSVTAQISVDI